jgi:hypothetical protein
MSSKPNSAPPGDDFNFDFGFASGGKAAGSQPKQPPAPANDRIAEIIASEIRALDEESDAKPVARPAGLQPTPVSVKPVVAGQRVAASVVPVKPVSVAPRPVESERFTSTPAFGKPAAATPIPHVSTAKADVDPIDELEGLIGESLRPDPQPAPRPVAASSPPVVPPLNTSFGPRRANLKEKERNDPPVESAEAAILAAAAATGAEVGRLDVPPGGDRPYRRMKVKPPKTSLFGGARQYVGIAVAGTLLLASGFGLYWVLGMGSDDPATAPVLTADIEPAKVAPAVSANLTVEPSSPVFDEINGVAADGGETLVSRDETEGETVTEVARIIEPQEDAATPESGLANRKVRTVTVRPDGTIVSGDDAVAGTALLPVERPDLPEIAGAEPVVTASAEPGESAGEAADPLNALVAESVNETSARQLDEPAPLEVVAIETPPVFDASIAAPLPMPRPGNRERLIGGSFQAAALVSEQVAPQDIGLNPAAPTPLVSLVAEEPAVNTSRGGAYVQLSSQKTENDAMSSLRATERRMAGMLDGASLEIRQVDLGAKGVWYRVVLPVRSFQDATQTCAAIKSNGGDCVAING